MHKDGFKGFGFFENDINNDVLENSSEFFTEARPYGKEMKIFLLTSKPVSGFLVEVVGFFSGF